jgi:hypothetical protein
VSDFCLPLSTVRGGLAVSLSGPTAPLNKTSATTEKTKNSKRRKKKVVVEEESLPFSLHAPDVYKRMLEEEEDVRRRRLEKGGRVLKGA